MKKILEAILCAILWITDFDNILLWFLIPGGLIALGVMIEAGWLYYVLALGGYIGICRGISKLIDRAVDKGNDKFEKWLNNRKN